MPTPLIAVLRDGRRVRVAEHKTKFNRTWQRDITDHVRTFEGEIVPGWEVVRFEDPQPLPAA